MQMLERLGNFAEEERSERLADSLWTVEDAMKAYKNKKAKGQRVKGQIVIEGKKNSFGGNSNDDSMDLCSWI